MRPFLRLAVAAVVATLLLGACGGGGEARVEPAGELPAATTTTSPAPTPPPTSGLAELVRPAGSTATLPEAVTGPTPVGLRYGAIGADAAVVAVGVEPNGDMSIPGATEVGWYRYGPTPGAEGSAVLAAHVAYGGRDGVFRRLTASVPGDRFDVVYDDGSTRTFEVVALRQYDKDELPTAEIFAVTGGPQVVLVTCGGSFNRELRSYDDNVVAYAVPV